MLLKLLCHQSSALKAPATVGELGVLKSMCMRPTEKILVFSLQLGCMLERNSLIGLLKSQNR